VRLSSWANGSARSFVLVVQEIRTRRRSPLTVVEKGDVVTWSLEVCNDGDGSLNSAMDVTINQHLLLTQLSRTGEDRRDITWRCSIGFDLVDTVAGCGLQD
jgi:hypothetical protein